ncbi:hypothetical protein NL676_019243 [Syzygium grande]|nr:hypothetical protein NL676_019243 [Syzygium grande]
MAFNTSNSYIQGQRFFTSYAKFTKRELENHQEKQRKTETQNQGLEKGDTSRAKSTSFCLLSSAKVFNRSDFKSRARVVPRTRFNRGVDLASLRDWTACMAPVDGTSDLHSGLLVLLRSPQVTRIVAGA